MQPIHIVTCGGHLNILSTLIERFGVDPQEANDVCMIVCMYV